MIMCKNVFRSEKSKEKISFFLAKSNVAMQMKVLCIKSSEKSFESKIYTNSWIELSKKKIT